MERPTIEGGSDGYEMGEVLELATAIADREMHETDIDRSLMGDMVGVQLDELPRTVHRSIAVAKTTLLIRRLEDPQYSPTFDEVMSQVDVAPLKQEMEAAAEAAGETVNAEQIMDVTTGFIKQVFEGAGVGPDARAQNFARRFNMAKLVAEERGVTPADVYRDDDLYVEMISRTYTAEECAVERLKTVDIFTEKLMSGFALQIAGALVPAEVRDQLGEEEIAAMILETQSDPEFKEGIEHAVAAMHEASREMTVAYIIRIWGLDAVHALPEALQVRLGITESRLTARNDRIVEVGGLAVFGVTSQEADVLVLREAFVHNYFAERGWDANNPTIEQVLEVRAQPGWQTPSA